MPAVVFVHLGKGASRWLVPNAVATQKRFGVEVYIGSDQRNVLKSARTHGIQDVFVDSGSLPDVLQPPEKRLSPRYRQGFWIQTTRRLFALSALHQAIGQDSLVHIESDIYLMPQIDLRTFDSLPTDLAFGLADDKLASGAIIYSRSRASSDLFARSLEEVVSSSEASNDMEALMMLWKRHRDHISILPTLPPGGSRMLKVGENTELSDEMSRYVEHFGGIFDVSCIGQYLTGTDGRNAKGIVYRYLEPPAIAMSPSMLDFQLADESISIGLTETPHPVGLFPLLSLHVHSKRVRILRESEVNWGTSYKRAGHVAPESSLDAWALGQWIRDSVVRRLGS